MSTFRVVKDKNFTVMSNHHLKNQNLSLKAKGLLSLMLSLPEEWNYSQEGLAAICKDGISSISSALKELEDERYLIRHRLRDDKGLLNGSEYVIYEFPHDVSDITEEYDNGIDVDDKKNKDSESIDFTEFHPKCENRILDKNKDICEPKCENPRLDNPILEKPILDNPVLDNQGQSNKDILNNNILNTNKSNINSGTYHIQSNHIHMDYKIRDQSMEDEIREDVMCQIEYEIFEDDVSKQRIAKEICEIMIECFLSKKDIIYISGEEVKMSELQSRLKSLTHEHIDYVINSIRSSSRPIKKMKQYILASLYNAATTYNAYVQLGIDLWQQ